MRVLLIALLAAISYAQTVATVDIGGVTCNVEVVTEMVKCGGSVVRTQGADYDTPEECAAHVISAVPTMRYFALRENADRCEYPTSTSTAGLEECTTGAKNNQHYVVYMIYCPTPGPTKFPTFNPTLEPSLKPTKEPSMNPSLDPSLKPTSDPVTTTMEIAFDPTSDPATETTMAFDPTSDPASEPGQSTEDPIDCADATDRMCSCDSEFMSVCVSECASFNDISCYPSDVLRLEKIFDDDRGSTTARCPRFRGAGKRIRSVVRDWMYSDYETCRREVQPKHIWKNMKELTDLDVQCTSATWTRVRNKFKNLKNWYDSNPDSLECM